MGSSYKELKRLVDKGDLSITYIDAPPRTGSSAIFRSLAQIVPACAYEPFHFSSHGFNKGLDVLLEKAEEAGVYSSASAKPVRLVAKEIARYLPAGDWERWMPLVENFIAITRDPHLQMHSLIKRAANDMHYGRYGTSGLSDAQVWELAERVGSVFKDGGSIAGRPIPCNFDRACWQPLSEHLAKLDAYLLDHPRKQLMVIDGFLLRAMPHAIMSELLTLLGIKHDVGILAKVVSKWDSNTGPHIKRAECPQDDAYRKRVVGSTGYEPPLDETPPLAMFPTVFQDHLKDSAMPIYLDFLRNPDRMGPQTPQALLAVFNQRVDGISLVERNPVTAYALMASLEKEGLQALEKLEQAEQLRNLGTQFPDHADAFGLIDRIVSGSHTPGSLMTVSRTETVLSGDMWTADGHIFLTVHGFDPTKRKVFHCLAVKESHLRMLKKEIRKGAVNLKKYGTVLASGYGYTSSRKMQERVKASGEPNQRK